MFYIDLDSIMISDIINIRKYWDKRVSEKDIHYKGLIYREARGYHIVNCKNKYKSLEKVVYYDESGMIVKEVYTEEIKFKKPVKAERVEMDFVRGLKSNINDAS